MENRSISGQYPPGSTYKPVVAAAALEEGLITPETTFYCNGTFEMGDRIFRCWQEKGHGHVNLHRAIVESCDVYFYNLGKLLGVDRIAAYARAFGLGAPLGIDLPREKGGLIPTKQWKLSRFREPWQPGETISIAIGQGFNLVTPLQLANVYATLANGGTLYRPRLIKQLESSDGHVVKVFEPEKQGVLPVQPEDHPDHQPGPVGGGQREGGNGVCPEEEGGGCLREDGHRPGDRAPAGCKRPKGEARIGRFPGPCPLRLLCALRKSGNCGGGHPGKCRPRRFRGRPGGQKDHRCLLCPEKNDATPGRRSSDAADVGEKSEP